MDFVFSGAALAFEADGHQHNCDPKRWRAWRPLASDQDLAKFAEQVLSKELTGGEFHLTKINLAATNFSNMQGNSVAHKKQQSLLTAFSGKRQSVTAEESHINSNSGRHQPNQASMHSAVLSGTYRNDYHGPRPDLLMSKAQERQLREFGARAGSNHMSKQELQELERPCFDLLSDDDTPTKVPAAGHPEPSIASVKVAIEVQSSDDEAHC